MDTITFVRNDETGRWFTESGQEVVFKQRLRPFTGYYAGQEVQITHATVHIDKPRYAELATFNGATIGYAHGYDNISSFTVACRVFVNWVLGNEVTVKLDYKKQLEDSIRVLTAKHFGGHE